VFSVFLQNKVVYPDLPAILEEFSIYPDLLHKMWQDMFEVLGYLSDRDVTNDPYRPKPTKGPGCTGWPWNSGCGSKNFGRLGV
jgi:hypothetical protein